MIDAATKVWVCEEGHVDDHHLEDGGVCLRCGGGGQTLDRVRGDAIDAKPCGDCGGTGNAINKLCSRCGGTCEQFSLDGLAREYQERLRVNLGLITENRQLKDRLAGSGQGGGDDDRGLRKERGHQARRIYHLRIEIGELVRQVKEMKDDDRTKETLRKQVKGCNKTIRSERYIHGEQLAPVEQALCDDEDCECCTHLRAALPTSNFDAAADHPATSGERPWSQRAVGSDDPQSL